MPYFLYCIFQIQECRSQSAYPLRKPHLAIRVKVCVSLLTIPSREPMMPLPPMGLGNVRRARQKRGSFPMKVDVSGVLRSVLPNCRTEDDLDALLTEECARRYGAQHHSVLRAVSRFLDTQAKRNNESRLAAARRMVQGAATLEQRTFSSLDEMPPEVRARVKEMIESGKGNSVTEHVVRYDAASGAPPPPEVIAAMKDRVRQEHGPLTRTFVVGGGGGWLKAALFALALLLLIAVLALLYWMKVKSAEVGKLHPASSGPACMTAHLSLTDSGIAQPRSALSEPRS